MTERASLKPIPKSYKGWKREVEGIESFLMNIPEAREEFGEKWARNMIKYNRERLAVLRANKPRTPLDRK